MGEIGFDVATLRKSKTVLRANSAWEAAKTEKEGVDSEKADMVSRIGELEHEIRIMTSEAELFK